MGSGLELSSYSSKTCANVLSLSVLLVTPSNNVSFLKTAPSLKIGLRSVFVVLVFLRSAVYPLMTEPNIPRLSYNSTMYRQRGTYSKRSTSRHGIVAATFYESTRAFALF